MSTIKTYDAAKYVMSFGGIIMTGLAPDSFMKVSRNADAFSLQVGADGSGVRSRLNDKSGTITFSLLQSSPVNDLLSAVAASDELLGIGIRTCAIKDLNGTTEVLAANAWVKKLPDVENGKEAGTRDWVIETDRLDMFVGGEVL